GCTLRLFPGATEYAAQNHVSRIFGLFTGGSLHPGADARYFHLPREKSQRSPPIRTLLRRHTSDRVISGNIKPGGFAIDEEEILFRGLVFPTHFAGATKISDPGLHANNPAIFAVSLKKSSLECVCGAIA